MRILDCGAHDGFIGLHAQRNFDNLHVDGIELNSEAVAIANRRAQAEGYSGVYKQGAAEDAPSLFEEGSYDAVVAYELIEHVAQPERLLSVCERMLRPGGWVFISTPDGTFGEGKNPHHLRVYRAIDLADMLRKRGQIQSMVVGPDGLTVVAYTPMPRYGDIAIFTGPGFQRWSPHDIESKGLGGSETAATRLGAALGQLGYAVTLYGDVEEGVSQNVVYRRHEVFDPTEKRLAVISSRIPELFDRPINADNKFLWLHDTDCGDRLTPERAAHIDKVFTLSDWHTAHVSEAYPFVVDKLHQIRNGIEFEYFKNPPAKRKKQVVYSSSPDRGLDILLEIWPRVTQRVPDAELVYCYADVYNAAADANPEVGAHRERIRELSKQWGVRNVGSLSHPDLAALMMESLVWAHPSYCTPAKSPFFETSCIGAAEAQAAGCAIVASRWGAIPETARHYSRLIRGPVDTEWRMHGWKSQLADGIVNALKDVHTQQRAQALGPEAIAGWDWYGVADMVAALLPERDAVAA